MSKCILLKWSKVQPSVTNWTLKWCHTLGTDDRSVNYDIATLSH